MNLRPPEADRVLASRFECKYLVAPARLDALRRFLDLFCRPDAHAVRQPGFRYRISSLYLDSDDLVLHRMTAHGLSNRFKLRVRTYGDEPDRPVYLEIKKRANQVILKRRAAVPRTVVPALLAGEPVGDAVPADARPVAAEFREFVRRTRARPTVRIRYDREAYESRGGDPVRITFDTAVAYAPTRRPELSMNGHGWSPAPIEGVVLEVKFTDHVPGIVRTMIRDFDLRQQPCSKYMHSIDHALARGTMAAPGRRDL